MNNLQISHEFWEINGIRMHVALAGSGPTIILLHGFPEIWYSWRNLIPLLAEKFRVIAPDLRGCGQTQITKKGYDLETLTRDVVGHDWGGVIGWHAATAYPDRVKAYVTVAGPHPARYFELMFTNLRQFFMSWYTIYFQIPFIPELTTSALNGLIFKWIMQRTTVKKEALTQKDLTEYQQSWTYARLSAGINYYRQLARRPFWTLDFYKKHKAECPVCVVWADKDFALSLAQTAGLKRFCQKEPEIHIISDCGHWIPMEASKELHDIIIDFLNRNP